MPTVFISYSHKDAVWKDRLATQLAVLESAGLLEAWDDRRIAAGQDWEQEIEAAMRDAAVAVLMISPDFLASKFVRTKEIPLLLERREQEGMRVVPVIVRPCAWKLVPWLSAMQARPRDGRPLVQGNRARYEADLTAIVEEIAEILQAFEMTPPATGAPEAATSPATTRPQESPLGPDRRQPELPEAAPKAPARVAKKPVISVADLPDTFTITEPIRMEFVRVPAGPFLMGSDKSKDPDAYDDELPQHSVEIESDFYIGKYPVTNAQYAVFARATGRNAPPSGMDDHPVVNVTWHDAVAFTEWLSQQTGKAFRLPAEPEWEKAARGTDGRIYPWGNDWDPKKANTREGGPGRTMPVGAYSPDGDSPYGCADMAGNVWEWTGSLYQPYPYDPSDGREDPRGEAARVLRGGAYYYNPRFVRCAYRVRGDPDLGLGDFGFRVVASP